MSANSIWIAGYFGPVAGASPVWIAPSDGTVPSAVQSEIVSFFSPVAGATAVWIAGFFAPPPAAIGATPITISGWGGSGGGGGGHSAEALAYLARTVGGNEGGNGANIATLIDGLVADGVWAKLDALYVLAQQNETDAKLNLVGTSYGLTQTGSLAKPWPRTGTLVFAPYQGFSGFNTAGSYFNTGLTPVTAPSPNFIQNSASFGFWSYAAVTGGTAEMGQSGGDNNQINGNYNGTTYARVNDSSSGPSTSPASNGLYVGDRYSSTNSSFYYNGVLQNTLTTTSVWPPTTFLIGTTSGVGTPETLSAAFIGASLGAAGQLALYNRLRTYMTAVGVP